MVCLDSRDATTISRGLNVAGEKAVLLISCLDQPGIIARVSNHLFRNGCNIITSDQHTDFEDGHFFWRIYFDSASIPIEVLRSDLR